MFASTSVGREPKTPGDAIIWFAEANAVHMGDNFFAGTYPFVDVDSGGSVDGMIAAVQMVIEHADSDTKIIPGHGPISAVGDLVGFRDMLRTARDRVRTMINDGRTLEEVLASAPTADLDATWGQGWMTPERFLTAVYTSLAAAGH